MTVSHYLGGVWVSGQGEAEPRAARRLLIDLTPLRRSRDFRHLVWGELVSVLGNQLTTVAVPYQVTSSHMTKKPALVLSRRWAG